MVGEVLEVDYRMEERSNWVVEEVAMGRMMKTLLLMLKVQILVFSLVKQGSNFQQLMALFTLRTTMAF